MPTNHREDEEIDAHELDLDAIRDTRVFWVTGTGLSEEPSRTATLAALAHRAKAGITVFPTGGLGGVHRGASQTYDESADLVALARASAQLGGGEPELREGIAVLAKTGPTPAGFPRRPGIAKKRPLA